jgi:hypothetical protein
MNPNTSNTMPEVSKDITDELSKVDNKPNIPPVTNSNIIQMPIYITVPEPIVVRQPSPPRKCIDCKCDISPDQVWMWDKCEKCFEKTDNEARRRHY